ncbi:MAG: GDP-mannose 4,6-dehydratase, partial [Candidatus Pacebacteria bacterium]|nr:GDP-mannose 4,6-dehydratase [Candidatus Paceibacterota bacterium]
YYQNQGLDSTVIRYSNVFGPRQSFAGEGGVVSIFINDLMSGKKPIIFGTGKQTRDFLYVEDAVRAAILAQNCKKNSVYNIGTNKETEINDLLNLISKLLKKQEKPYFYPFRPGEIIRSKVDFSKAKRELGWQPEFTLKDGLEKTIKFFQKANFTKF